MLSSLKLPMENKYLLCRKADYGHGQLTTRCSHSQLPTAETQLSGSDWHVGSDNPGTGKPSNRGSLLKF